MDAAAELANLQRDIELFQAENRNLKRLLGERNSQLEDIRASTSWRITAPLRTLRLWMKRQRWLDRGPPARTRGDTFEIDQDEYQRWLRSYSTVDDAMRRRLETQVEALASRPLISIVMPSYNIEPALLRAAISSVRRQIYPHWELCISDDASTLAGVRALIEEQAAEDARIRATFRERNGHISANSNTALDLARGEYIALMDADDLLPEDALFWVAHEISLHPEVDLIFTDEDKIDEAGRRIDPFFKPAWNPALMLSQNAFCHLGVYRRSLVEKVGRFREGYEGAQDHDLVLRCAEATTPDRIRHIPRVLYHWRSTPQSTAAGLEAKPYAANAGHTTIEDALRRRGIAGRIKSAAGNFYQAVYDAPRPPPLVTIIVPTTLQNDETQRCLQSILTKTRYDNFELLLVATEDDLSTQSRGDLMRDPRVRTIGYPSAVFNHSRVCNLGAAEARGPLLCFLNDDVEVIGEDWLEQLVARVSLDGVGAAGPMLYYPSDRVQHAGVVLGIGDVGDHAFRHMDRGQNGYFARGALEQDYNCLTAACLLVRRDLFKAVGGFDETLAGAFNDIDLCIRIRRTGARMIWTPTAQLYHHESLTFGAPEASNRATQFIRDVATVNSRWRAAIGNDPCYNPNLSIDPKRQFQLATPPRTAFGSSSGWLDPHRTISRTAVLP